LPKGVAASKADGSSPATNTIAATQFSHICSNGGTPTVKIMSRSGGFKYTLPTTSQYYRWWIPTGLQPTVNIGRTAGIWSTTGEAVRKYGWVVDNGFGWARGSGTTSFPNLLLPPSGATYNMGSVRTVNSIQVNYNSGDLTHARENSMYYAKEKN